MGPICRLEDHQNLVEKKIVLVNMVEQYYVSLSEKQFFKYIYP